MIRWESVNLVDPAGIRDFDADRFPIVDEFSIELFRREGSLALRYTDGDSRVLVDFPWWDAVDRDLGGWTLSDIPVGSLGDPYLDIDQSWQILIWESDRYVYVMQGADDVYRTGFRVRGEQYRKAWSRAIETVRGN